MVIGGVAASILGRPHLTQDVDALTILPEADSANAISAAASDGEPTNTARTFTVVICSKSSTHNSWSGFMMMSLLSKIYRPDPMADSIV
jgi:hypothetical protein